MNSMQLKNQYLTNFSENRGRFLVWGIALVILGMIAISLTTMTTVVSVIFLGTLILIGGIVILIDAFSFWWKKWSAFFLLLLLGIAYLLVGFMLIESPILASVSLTLFLGIFYLIAGIFRVIYSLSVRTPSWGWDLLSGILSLVLGVLIVSSWPQSGLYIIGLFIGIDLLFTGWTYIMASLAAHSLAKK